MVEVDETIRKRADKDKWAWEIEREKVAAQLSDGELSRYIQLIVCMPIDGHAYSKVDLKELRKILQINADEWPDDLLHRLTDELAVLIGLLVKTVRPGKRKEQIKEIENKLLQPANIFLEALANKKLKNEYLQPWSPLKSEHRDKLISSTQLFVSDIEKHLADMKSVSKRGRQWDSELKRLFVNYVDQFCEYLNHDFEPTRIGAKGSQFENTVYLLAKPLQWGEHEGEKIVFEGAIRKHVDWWNERLRQVVEEAKQSNGG